MDSCSNCGSLSMEEDSVICTECGYSSVSGKVLQTGYEARIEKLRGSWAKTGIFLLTCLILLAAAFFLYAKVSDFESNGGVLVLPKVLMALYSLGGKYSICGIFLFLALISLLNAIAYLPWTFIESEWFISFLYKLVTGFKYLSYSVIILTICAAIFSAYSFYSESKLYGERMNKIDIVISNNGDYEHVYGLQKKNFAENLVHQEKWAEFEKAMGQHKLLLILNYSGGRKQQTHISLDIMLNSRYIKGFKGPFSDGRTYLPLTSKIQYKKLISDNKLSLSDELCKSIISQVLAIVKK